MNRATDQKSVRARVALLLAGLLLVSAPTLAATSSPTDVIKEASNELAEQLAARKSELAADSDALYAMVDTIILPRFDRRYAAQLVLGRNWRNASDEQRAAFIDAYYQNLLRKYADGVLEFDQERIEIMPFRGDESKGRVVVKTRVTLDDGTTVPVDYGLSNRSGDWMVFDVIIEGISYVRNFRAELNSEIQTSSLDAVIARLQREAQPSAGE